MSDFVFVLEQTLGHVSHGQNLERVVAADPDVDPTFIKIGFDSPAPLGVHNWSVRASWAARMSLTRHLQSRHADAIFMHTQVTGLMSADLVRRVPTVISLDATPVNYDRVGSAYEHRVAPPAIESVKRWINHRLFNAAGALVTWCRWAADSLRDDYGVDPDKVHVIPPGVDPTLFSPGAGRREGPVRLLFVGGAFERKGGGDLLAALDSVRGEIELDLVTGAEPEIGDHPFQVRVHRRLRPQSAELLSLYREADIFVLPARGDCLPQAIAEAMACGLPVVATSVGAISEMVRDLETGILVPPASPRRLAEAISALVGDRARRQALGNAGLQVARRDHDMRRNNRSILDLMDAVAKQPGLVASLP